MTKKEVDKYNNNKSEIYVDEGSFERLKQLCVELGNTAGLVMVSLEIAQSKKGDEREACFERARRLSVRGVDALKRFLWEMEGIRRIALERMDSEGEKPLEG